MVKTVDRILRALETRLRSPEALRLLARLRRRQHLVLGALLGLGILLMVIHWWGTAPSRALVPGPPPTSAGAAAPAMPPAGFSSSLDARLGPSGPH